jgi:hypothetical protein
VEPRALNPSRTVRPIASVWAGILPFHGLGGDLPINEKIPAQTLESNEDRSAGAVLVIAEMLFTGGHLACADAFEGGERAARVRRDPNVDHR